ncbi:MAG TPA: hypothetical protein VHA05_01730 [Candidatus Saccharimonadales bacterium]|nr:hypothetical protein [Candidatus Saccharimonadales bacterium]
MKTLNSWHQTRVGLLFFGLIELGIAYGFASLAIDRGNFLWYLLALVFLVGALQNIFKLIGKLARKK